MSRNTPDPKPVPDETTAVGATLTDGPPQPEPSPVQTDPADTQADSADTQPEPTPTGSTDPTPPPPADTPPEPKGAELADTQPMPTVKESGAPEADGDHYRVGYFGKLPNADDRPDLTLSGVIGTTTDGTTPVAADTDTTQEK